MRVSAHDRAGKGSLDSDCQPLICSILAPTQALGPALSLIYLPAGFYFGDKIAALIGVGIWGKQTEVPPKNQHIFTRTPRALKGGTKNETAK